MGEIYALAAGEPACRTQTGRIDLDQLAGTDWQNDYADFVSNLKAHLGKIRNERARKAALADMRRVLDGNNAARAEHRMRPTHQRGRDRSSIV